MGPGGGGIGGYTPVPQMHPGAMSLEGHNGISNEQPDQDGNPQVSRPMYIRCKPRIFIYENQGLFAKYRARITHGAII